MGMNNLVQQKNITANDQGEFDALSAKKGKNSILLWCHFKMPLLPVTILFSSFPKA